MRKTFMILNFVVANSLLQPAMAQSTLEQWQKLVPNSGTSMRAPEVVQVSPLNRGASSQAPAVLKVTPQRFVDPYDAEMKGAAIAARRGQWSQAWQSFGHGLNSLFDPQLNAARLELENEKTRK